MRRKNLNNFSITILLILSLFGCENLKPSNDNSKKISSIKEGERKTLSIEIPGTKPDTLITSKLIIRPESS